MNVRLSAALAATFRATWRVAFLCAVFAASLVAPAPALGASYAVDRTDDITVSACSGAVNDCTLRGAIAAAVATGAGDVITFDASVMNQTFTITSALALSGSGGDTIDGTGSNIIIKGNSEPAAFDCLDLNSPNNIVKGLQLTDCSRAIDLSLASSDSNTIGPGNTIFDNATGVVIGSQFATGNVIIGNKIGTDVAGTAIGLELRNSLVGIHINSAPGNTVGGIVAASRNIISGNQEGIRIEGATATGNLVRGNFVGTDVTGTVDLGNTTFGVRIASGASGNTIGGSGAEGNLISGNSNDNVVIATGAPNNNVVKGNIIGTDVNGNGGAMTNGASGVSITAGTGNIVGPDNVISGNLDGVVISGSTTTGNVVKGNRIGTDLTGTAGVPNLRGIRIDLSSTGNAIGSVTPGDANIIAFNTSEGVKVDGAATTGNAIRANSIHDNGLAEIALVNSGNGSLAAPAITHATPNSVVGTACANCAVDVFSDGASDAEFYEGSVTANGSGNFSFIGSIAGPNVTATNTNAGSNTSPLSAASLVLPDADSDTIPDSLDNCPAVANQNQADGDGDGDGNACDNCLSTPNADQQDSESDTVGDLCDNCYSTSNGPAQAQILGVGNQTDADGDGVPGTEPTSGSSWGGDACDADDDNDGIPDTMDVCRTLAEDYDGFEDGDTCPDVDNDGDGVCDAGQTSVSCSGSDSGKNCFDPAGTLSCPTHDCRNTSEDMDAFKDSDGCPEPDNDNDGVADTDDGCDGSDAIAGADGMLGSPQDLNHNGVRDNPPEAVFTLDDVVQVFEDYDGVLDTDGCHDSPGEDFDGDGFTDDAEALSIGTNAGYPCGPGGWPADLVGNDNRLNIGDLNSFLFPLRSNGSFNKFGHPVPDLDDANIARWNLQVNATINIGDLNAVNPAVTAPTSRPPMFNGQPAFFTNGGQCPLPP